MPQLMNNNKDQQGQNQLAILQSLIDINKKNISPYQQGIEKALKQAGEKHTVEAIEQGVPANHIIEQSGLTNDPSTLINKLLQSSQPQSSEAIQPQMQQQNQPVQKDYGMSDPLTNIFSKIGIRPTGQEEVLRTQAALNRQKLAGEEPIQATDLLKQTIDLKKQGMLSPEALMNKFEQASQPFITQRDSFARIQSLANDPSPAGDLGLIFSYMKLLDPASTVREGEQATAENARGVPDSIRNLYGKIITGKKLTSEQRSDFMNRSSGIFKSIEKQQKKTTEEFSRLGKMNGIDPKRFIRDTGLSQNSNNEPNKPQQIGRFQVRTR